MSGEANVSLRDRYELFRAIGADESAEIFQARDRADDAPVQVRIIRFEAMTSDQDLRKMLGYVSRALAWKHPRAVLVREAGIDNGRGYVVTERPRGVPLAERIATGEPGPLQWAAGIVDGALEVVDAAIVAGIAHPGMTPDNIFVTPTARVEVSDFGLPVLRSSAAPSDAAPLARYVRPLEAAPLGSASTSQQVYAAAALLLWLVSGKPPFPGETVERVTRRHQSTLAPTLISVSPGAPPELSAVLTRCLRKDPAGRPRSIGELRLALAMVFEGRPAPLTVLTPVADVEPERKESFLHTLKKRANRAVGRQ